MKNPLSRIKAQWLQFVIIFLLLAALLGLMKYPLLELLTNALFFAVLMLLAMRRRHRPLDCGEHEHQHRLCVRNLMLVVECRVCRQRWHLREPRPGHMTLTWFILDGICWFLLAYLEEKGVISSAACRFLRLGVSLLLVLLVDAVFYLRLRGEEPARLAGADFELDI